jgi:hypothetical protein
VLQLPQVPCCCCGWCKPDAGYKCTCNFLMLVLVDDAGGRRKGFKAEEQSRGIEEQSGTVQLHLHHVHVTHTAALINCALCVLRLAANA